MASASPVFFEPRLRQYYLVIGNAELVMRFCFWCGGALPAATPQDLILEPTAEDIAAVRVAMEGVRSAENLFARLGRPDETLDENDLLPGDVSPIGEKALVWRRQFKFSKLWTSLDLVVQELPSGDIECFMLGKPKVRGPDSVG